MILATDVHYPANGGARAAGVLFDDWASGVVTREVMIPIDAPAPYVPGRFALTSHARQSTIRRFPGDAGDFARPR